MKKLSLAVSVICLLSLAVYAKDCIDKEELQCDGHPIICKDQESNLVNGVVCEKYPGGAIFSRAPFKEGKVDGVQKIYYENGRISNEINFKNGIRDGVTRYYDLNGKIIVEEIWQKDVRKETKKLL